MTKQLKRVRITYEVLMNVEDSISDLDMSEIFRECQVGGLSGRRFGIDEEEILEGQEDCAAACRDHGTDLEFFFDEDSDTEWDDGWGSSEYDDEEGTDPDPAADPTITL